MTQDPNLHKINLKKRNKRKMMKIKKVKENNKYKYGK
jgi:hypothetical protein